jgi:hypothetical protein
VIPDFCSLLFAQTDPLSLLLAKHIPPEQRPGRDVTGDWQRADVHTLVVSTVFFEAPFEVLFLFEVLCVVWKLSWVELS